MTILIVGVLIWIGVHLVPVLARPLRQSLIDRFGKSGYRGIFSLAAVAAIVVIVFGWQAAPQVYLFALPPPVNAAAFVLICISFILIGAANHPSSIKRYIRHPMLLGVAIWALGHVLLNGMTRDLVLFGGIGAWALIEIVLLNRRDGAYTKPESPSFSEELRGMFFSAGVLLLVMFLHPYFTGVAAFPY